MCETTNALQRPQFGFIEGKSSSAIIKMIECLAYSLEEGHLTIAKFVSFSKAFDCLTLLFEHFKL